MENNNSQMHPFGENPFGENFDAGESIFGKNKESEDGGMGNSPEGGTGEDMVCPHCGMKLEVEETYCMNCGMTVNPVLKKDYDKAMSENNGGYGNGGYGNGGASPAPSSPVRIQEDNPLNKIIMIVAAAVVLIGVIFFAVKWISSSNQEKTVVLTKTQEQNGVTGKAVITLYGKGDKLYRASEKITFDVTGYDNLVIEVVKNALNKWGESFKPFSKFVTFEVGSTDHEISIDMEFNYLNVMENMQALVDNDMLGARGKKEKVKIKDYISINQTVTELKEKGYKVQ